MSARVQVYGAETLRRLRTRGATTRPGLAHPGGPVVYADHVGGAYPPNWPRYTLPRGMVYNPVTDWVEGTVWNTTAMKQPVQGGTEVRPQNGAELRAALLGAQLGQNIILRTDTLYTLVPPGSSGLTMPIRPGANEGTGRVWCGPESIYNGSFPVASTAGAGVSPTTPLDAFAKVEGGLGGGRLLWWQPDQDCGHTTIAGWYLRPTANMGAIFKVGDALGLGVAHQSKLPQRVLFDRMHIDGMWRSGRRIGDGFAVHARYVSVEGSYLAWLYEDGVESHGFNGYGGVGPFKFNDNVLNSFGGIPWMYGGERHYIYDECPHDFEVQGVYITHAPAARTNVGSLLKNLFEIKAGERVLVQGCVFERVWQDQQDGNAILIKTSTHRNNTTGVDTDQRHIVTADVTVRKCAIAGALWGVSIASRPDGAWSRPAHRIEASDIVMIDAHHPDYVVRNQPGPMLHTGPVNRPRMFSISGAPANSFIPDEASHSLTLDRVTAIARQRTTAVFFSNGAPWANSAMTRCILGRVGTPTSPGSAGIVAEPQSDDDQGRATLDLCLPGVRFASNAIAEVPPATLANYPTENDNIYPATSADLGFGDPASRPLGAYAAYVVTDGPLLGRGANVAHVVARTADLLARASTLREG